LIGFYNFNDVKKMWINLIRTHRRPRCKMHGPLLYFRYASEQGRSQTFSFGRATGGASCATRGAVNGLCRTSVQWHDVTRKIFGGTLGGPGKIFGGLWPSWHPPSSAPAS